MDEMVANGVTQHLSGCRRCRDAVSKARRALADTRLVTTDEREGSQVTHLPVRCQRCGAQYAIPEERARGRRLTVRCMSCGGQMEIEGDKSGLLSGLHSSPSLVTGETGERCWYVVEDRERKGPYSELDLCKMIERGKVGHDTHVWREGYDQWRPLETLPQFQAMFGEPVQVKRASTDPFPPPPRGPEELSGPGYDPARVAGSMLADEDPDDGLDDDTHADAPTPPGGFQTSTDQLPLISNVAPGPVAAGANPARTAIIDPVAGGGADSSESEIRTVMLPPADEQDEVSESALKTALHSPGQAPYAPPRAPFRLDSESNVSTELHDPGYTSEEVQAQAAALAHPTLEEGDPTHRAGLVERTAEIEMLGGDEPEPLSDEARTRLHYAPRDPRDGLLDDEPGEADELAGLFDGGRQEPSSRPQRTEIVEPEPPAPEPSPAPAPEPAAETPTSQALESGAWDRRMAGQRNDNSVLFSLQHLKNLAGGPVAMPREESGLVDIEAIPGDNAPAPAPPPLIIPVAPQPGNRMAMVLTVGMLGVLLGACALLGLLYMARPELFSALLSPGQQQSAATTAAAPAPGPAPAPRPAPGPAPAPVATPDAGATVADAAPVPADAAGVAAEPPPQPGAATPPRPASPGARPAPSRPKPASKTAVASPQAAPRPTPAPKPAAEAKAPDPNEDLDPFATGEKPAPVPKPRSKPTEDATDKELDDLINAATTGDLPPARKPRPRRKKRPRPAPAPRADRSGLPKSLARHQVAAGMKRANPAVVACRERHNQVGLVTVSVTISGATGRVVKGRSLGPLGSTPVGKCVLKAVKGGARFGRFSGPNMTIKYPFILR